MQHPLPPSKKTRAPTDLGTVVLPGGVDLGGGGLEGVRPLGVRREQGD